MHRDVERSGRTRDRWTRDGKGGRRGAVTTRIDAHGVTFVGVDENGLGPRLGPLVVTGVAMRGAMKAASDARPRDLGSLVGDSKALASHADVSLGEAWARALVTTLGRDASTPAAVFSAISLDSIDTLQRPCPRRRDGATSEIDVDASPCWHVAGERFVATDAQVDACLAALARWSKRTAPLTLLDVATIVVCPSMLTSFKARGVNKLRVDLNGMERLVLALHERGNGASNAASISAICGKVGGTKSYLPSLGPLAGRLVTVVEESQGRSAYRFAGLGEVAFVRDADADDALVGLASLVGKWVRELMMGRIVGHLRARALDDESIDRASGYHDPVTARFVDATAALRARHSIEDRCFFRP
jgi:ribonuclease HII